MNPVLHVLELLLGLALGAGVVAFFVWLIPKMRVRRRVDRGRARQGLAEVRERLPNASFSEDSYDPVVLFEWRGYRGRLQYQPLPSTDVQFDLEGAVNGWMQVASESVSRGMIKTFVQGGLRTGDAFFDEENEVSASSEEFARGLLDAGNRSILRSLGARAEYVWRVSPHVMLLRTERHLYDPEELEAFVRAARDLFGALEIVDRGAMQIAEVRIQASTEGQCEICGAKLAMAPVVRCAKCRTPHHRECWTFNGVCSTFACGSREFA